ncbi:MAG: hypothetical protein OEW58_12330 [Gammaproteobacteria bacterium]|nr:hypothetical protein [Gammaproteobacteria bacterium]
MIYWQPFEYKGEVYSLGHLHPELWTFCQVKQGKNDAVYRIQVTYSLHTFTKGLREEHSEDLAYSDNKEIRTFCFNRYEWSHSLPGAIKGLDQGYVYSTGKRNFLRIPKGDGSAGEYEIFFTLTKASAQGVDLNLYVSSAYYRTYGSAPKAGKIRFGIAAFNIMHNKPIKVHRR